MSKIIQKAVESAGGQAALARAVGVKQQHVWNWLNRDRRVPAERCADIERATNGAVTRAELRPDVFGELKPEDAA